MPKSSVLPPLVTIALFVACNTTSNKVPVKKSHLIPGNTIACQLCLTEDSLETAQIVVEQNFLLPEESRFWESRMPHLTNRLMNFRQDYSGSYGQALNECIQDYGFDTRIQLQQDESKLKLLYGYDCIEIPSYVTDLDKDLPKKDSTHYYLLIHGAYRAVNKSQGLEYIQNIKYAHKIASDIIKNTKYELAEELLQKNREEIDDAEMYFLCRYAHQRFDKILPFRKAADFAIEQDTALKRHLDKLYYVPGHNYDR